MKLSTAITRAARSMREEARLHLVAISSLTIAFLGLGLTLLVSVNLDRIAEAWADSARISVFLRDGASRSDIEQLRLALEGLPEVASVEHVSASEARAEFLAAGSPAAGSTEGDALASIPADAFPASLEIALASGVTSDRSAAIGARIGEFAAVDEVETYQSWFAELDLVLGAGRGFVLALGLLVLLAVFFVVGNTIRLAVAGRRQEIEVMKLCGADDGFVRGPFLVEGAVQGFAAAFLSVLLLTAGFVAIRAELDGTLGALAGIRTAFLSPPLSLALLAAGTLAGVAGSALSLRRYLVV